MGDLIDRIIRLVERGWKGYEGYVDKSVYEELDCPAPIFGKWLFEGGKAQEMTCVGCNRECHRDSAEGFFPQPSAIAVRNFKNAYFSLSPQEMVKRLPLLKVDQAAYCLNMSERHVYELIAKGELAALREKPVRIKSADVAFLMNDFDE